MSDVKVRPDTFDEGMAMLADFMEFLCKFLELKNPGEEPLPTHVQDDLRRLGELSVQFPDLSAHDLWSLL